MSVRILLGDVRDKLRELPDESVHCVVTSPPYFGLRDYGVEGQIGLEPTPAEFVAVMVEVFREVRRVLRKDGTLWLNLGDSYASRNSGNNGYEDGRANRAERMAVNCPDGMKQKDLLGIPWRMAFALQADGWYLRQDIIWAKPNPMPESVTDRCTKAHEYLFLLSKSARYHYDAEAIAESGVGRETYFGSDRYSAGSGRNDSGSYNADNCATRNRRSVWTVATQPFKEAHFATFPPDLIEPCIKAGCPKDCCAKCGAPVVRQIEKTYEGSTSSSGNYAPAPNKGHLGNAGERAANMTRDGFIPNRSPVVTDLGVKPSCSCDAGLARGVCLDPFGGAGTTGLVADRLQRNAILIELNPEYAKIACSRIKADSVMFTDVSVITEYGLSQKLSNAVRVF